MKKNKIDEYIARKNLDRAAIAKEVENLRRRSNAYRLVEIRQRLTLTQRQLSETEGISRKTITRVEHGEISGLRLEMLERYAKGVGGRLRISIDFPDDSSVSLDV